MGGPMIHMRVERFENAGREVSPGCVVSCRTPSQRSCVNVVQTLHLFSNLENGGAGRARCSG